MGLMITHNVENKLDYSAIQRPSPSNKRSYHMQDVYTVNKNYVN